MLSYNIIEKVDEFNSGKLDEFQYLKSEKLPDNKFIGKTKVLKIVGKNFEELVMNKEKDFFLTVVS